MDLHESFCLLALQKVFCSYPKIGAGILIAAGDPVQVFANSDRWRGYFGDNEELWVRFRTFGEWGEVKRECTKAVSLGASLIGIHSKNYPPLLKEIYDPPPVLMVCGDPVVFAKRPAVAIVGARRATPHGQNVAASMAEELSTLGFTIVSGMAYGVDGAAHRGALRGGGNTIAVFGSGIDFIYPPVHERLAADIAKTGLLVSEFPLGTRPFKSNFPQRNRIISGLCVAVVIVEAAQKSGSLITAHFALEQNREVFAVPGLAGAPCVAGTNRLLREGATLVEGGGDVAKLLERYLPRGYPPEKSGHLGIDVDMDWPLLRAIPTRGDCSVDDLIAVTGAEPALLLAGLSRLVVAGLVDERPGRRFRRREENGKIAGHS